MASQLLHRTARHISAATLGTMLRCSTLHLWRHPPAIPPTTTFFLASGPESPACGSFVKGSLVPDSLSLEFASYVRHPCDVQLSDLPSPQMEAIPEPEPEASQPGPHRDEGSLPLAVSVSAPALSLGAHIRDSFWDSHESCAAQMARLGHDKVRAGRIRVVAEDLLLLAPWFAWQCVRTPGEHAVLKAVDGLS